MNINHSPALRGTGLVVSSAVLWGTVGIASKLLFGIAEVAPLTVGFYRLAIAAPLLFVVAHLLPQVTWASIDRRSAILFLALGVTQAGYQGLYFVAVARLGVTPATLIALCSAPVLITILAAILLAEQVRVLSWAAVPVAALGTVLLVSGPNIDIGRSGDVWGYAAAFGAAMSYAFFALASRRLARHYHPFQLVALGFGAGAIILLPIALSQGLSLGAEPTAWGLIVYMAVVPTAVAYAVFLFALRSVTATASGILVLAEPLTAAILASLFFSEALGPWGLAGGGLLISAVVMVSLPGQPLNCRSSGGSGASGSDGVRFGK